MKDLRALIFTTTVAIGNFIIFGLSHYRTWSDASEYSAYAAHLATSGFYSFDGVHFDIAREPGYPFFLALVYKIFGVGNLLAACFIQALLLGILGYVVYRIFAEHKEERIGLIAGIVVSALPSYGYYAKEILTELMFAVLMGLLFFIATKITKGSSAIGKEWYLLFGFISGYATLVRIQFLFFLPFILITSLIFLRPFKKETLSKIAVSCAIFVLVVGAWGFYVKQHIGHFALTEGRQESVLNIRAVRAELSYRELTQYATEWVKRSVSGGAHYALLDANEARGINEKYFAIATSSEMVARLKQQNIHTILTHPGQYLYGNGIEVMKMLYIEHDYTDSQSRYFRPVLYAFMYGFFLFGLVQIWKNWREKDMLNLAGLALFFLAYNLLILSSFDTVPRFNTPYLMFYIVIGFIGIILMRRGRGHPQA